MSRLIQWTKGNPGAVAFLASLATGDAKHLEIIEKLEKLTSIRGTNLYVLWSDLCEKDLDKVHNLIKNCPDEVLEDACSRQDYSGRELVTQYFE